jgi:glycosyltransferase involved in cell wall biosynthesis
MKILSLGLDNSVLDKNSSLVQRVIEFGNLVEKYNVIVPVGQSQEIELSGRVKIFGVAGAGKIFKLFRIYKLAKGLIERERYDVITVQDAYFLALAGQRLAKKFGLGLEIQIHGWEKFCGWRKIIARYLLPRASAVRVVSQRLKRELINKFGVEEKKITMVPIYSEVRSQKSEVRSRLGDEFVFLTVGRLVPVKNINLQIEAMADIVKIYPATRLWIVGDGPEKENLKFKIVSLRETTRRVENLKLGNNIKLLGWQNDLTKYYSQADAFLLTSNYEGWGLTVIEAASFGLAIVMTDVGCAGEVIKNGESGFVVPVGDKVALKQAMIKLIEDGELRKKMGEAARQAVLKLPGKEQTLFLYLASWQKAARHTFKL